MEKMESCRWCHKDVAEENLALHEMHCKRFLSLCPDCGQTVPTEQLEEHREEEHSLVSCSKCYQKMERCQLQDHEESECVERLQVCDFCELQLPFKALGAHRQVCGSRTERCSDCGLYVLLRARDQHSCCTSRRKPHRPAPAIKIKARPTTLTCLLCNRSFPEHEIYEHELKCVEVSRQKVDDTPRQGATPLKPPGAGTRTDDPEQIGTCPHCDLALPVSTLQWHQTKCQTHVYLKQKENM